MYFKCFLLLKLSSLATTLPIFENNVKNDIVSPYRNHITTHYPVSDGNRIEFQIRNHQGPGTYIFGFDTGHGKNRQYRVEERLKDGSVNGRYGFYDAKGKLRIINYIARPDDGYQERHHETISLQNLKPIFKLSSSN